MYKFNDLLKASNSKLDGKELRIAVLGNCSTQLLSKTIQGNCRIEGINANVFDADYNQIDLQLYNFSSETFSFNPEIIILWLLRISFHRKTFSFHKPSPGLQKTVV